MRSLRWLSAVLGLALVGGCSTADRKTLSGEQGTEEGLEFVQPGKEDNFLAPTAQEYMVEGVSTVKIESYLSGASEEKKLARVHELIGYKHVVIGWFLNTYLVEKSSGDSNASYGGFHALTKNGSYEEWGIEALDDITYQFTFRQEFGGKLNVMDKLPTTTGEDGREQFNLILGKISNDEMSQLELNNEWYRRSPWSSFSPDKVDTSRLENITLSVWPEPRSTDAWVDYNRLFEDGKLTMAVHFGWDYHQEYHIKHSRDVYNWLVSEEGFSSPVDSYDAYTRTSGPLTKTIMANGKPVQAEISLFWGKPGTETDPDTHAGGKMLEADMLESFRTRDVIMFSGHSGPFYGFALANWRKTDEGDIDDSEVPSIDMPSDRYQVVVAEGCDTYGLGQAFRMNPNKLNMHNLDVITTTSYSNASTAAAVRDSITAIIGTDSYENHRPLTYGGWLKDLDDNSYWFTTMYGVHGIDDNPNVHPYAVVENLCRECQSNADCGGTGNACVKLPSGEPVCTYQCTSNLGCKDGFECMKTQSGGTLSTGHCAPKGLSCTVEPETIGAGMMINEVLASPLKPNGDANGDGTINGREDEFVELFNASNEAIDISGWMVADSVMTRMVFPAGTTVAPGQPVVVFSGGIETAFSGLDGVVVFVAPSGLVLNNTGDMVTLTDANSSIVDEMRYGAEGSKGASLTRETDGDINASWVSHEPEKYSPGRRSDGSPF